MLLRQVIAAWYDVIFATSESNFGNDHIWSNFNVKPVNVDGKTVFYDKLYDKGDMKTINLFYANKSDNVTLDYSHFTMKFNVLNFPYTSYWG